MERKRSKPSRAAGKAVVVHSTASVEALSQEVDALAERLISWSAVESRKKRPFASTWQALCSKHFRLCALRSDIQKASKDAHDDDGDGFTGMDALPLHLQTTILASLPLQKFVQLRAVCSSWNSLLRSPALTRCWSSLHAVEAAETADMWMVMSRLECESPTLFKQFLAYSTSQGRLFPMPLDHPRVEASLGYWAAQVPFGSWRCMKHMNSLWRHPVMMCASGAGGLLYCLQMTGSVYPEICARKDFTDCRKHLLVCLSARCESLVLVFNPLTGVVRYLPLLPNQLSNTSSATQLSIHSQSGNHYYVVVHYCDCGGKWIFNSVSGLWKYSLPPRERQYGSLSRLSKGDLFHWDRFDSQLEFYSLRRDVWSKVPMSESCLEEPRVFARADFNTATFLKCNNRILLAAQLRNFYKGEPPISFGFVVWHLTIVSQEVRATLLSFTPKNTLQKALVSTCECDPVRSTVFRVMFTTNGTHICMTGCDHVVYDMMNDCWYRPPSNNGSFDYVGLSCFQPRLDADPYPPMSNKPSSATFSGMGLEQL